MAESWHMEMTSRLRQFHDKYARQPTAAIEEAKRTHTEYINYLAAKLKKEGLCSRVEYTGSAYEGVKVSNDIEFDIMVIKIGSHLEPAREASYPGYYYLKQNGSAISTEREVEDFFGILQTLVNNHGHMSRRVKLRSHGPAVQMDVYRKETDNLVWFSVDVVLSYQVGKHILVAKPLSSDQLVVQAWRLSYSLEEKALFDGIDRDNGCRKMVLRMLKVWRNREVGMTQLTSYHLKTALFHEMKEGRNWSQSELGARLIGVLRCLHGDMKRSWQPHFFNSGINLLDKMSQSTIENIRDRLQSILSSEYTFASVFQ